MNVLFVKMTSMGDLIHALPALTDAKNHIPELKVDWVIDEAFADVASWHPAVNAVITSAHRRWRQQKWHSIINGELLTFIKKLRGQRYDFVIDGQTNTKSVIVMLFSRGLRCGLDKKSARDPLASLVYQRKYIASRQEHAITRLRLLFSQVFGYEYQASTPDFGIDRSHFSQPNINLPQDYLMFIHNASWQTKLWPESHWAELIKKAVAQGFTILLPNGNDIEYARAKRLACLSDNVIALPRLRLSEVAYVLQHAKAAVCVDTGLSHLAAALNVPAITLYGATDPELTGAKGQSQIHLQAQFPCSPCHQQQCSFKQASAVKPACYATLTPALVWQALQSI